jgi:hypothetical protein
VTGTSAAIFSCFRRCRRTSWSPRIVASCVCIGGPMRVSGLRIRDVCWWHGVLAARLNAPVAIDAIYDNILDADGRSLLR